MTPCAFYAAVASVRVDSKMEARGQGSATDRRQGKRGSPVRIQAIVRACLSPCRPVGSRAAIAQTLNNCSASSGTVRYVILSGSRR